MINQLASAYEQELIKKGDSVHLIIKKEDSGRKGPLVTIKLLKNNTTKRQLNT